MKQSHYKVSSRLHSFAKCSFKSIASVAAFITLVGSPISAQEAKGEKKTDFLRVLKNEEKVLLQTAITRYSKGDITVDLIGAVHIADKVYYDQLNKEFTNYESLLFEMVGGEEMKNGKAPAAPAGAKKDAQLSFISSMYETMKKKLDLTGQNEAIDYSKANFVHADLSIKEFYALQKKKGESFFKLAIANAKAQAKLQAQGKAPNQPSSLRLLKDLLIGNSNGLKLSIVDTLGSGDDQIAMFAGKDSVIIGDRNAKCLKVMNDEITKGKTNLGIFYGAAHYPDMEDRLLKMGFKQTNHRWLNAWEIQKKQKKKKQVEAPLKKAA